jgi:hypothetical protein
LAAGNARSDAKQHRWPHLFPSHGSVGSQPASLPASMRGSGCPARDRSSSGWGRSEPKEASCRFELHEIGLFRSLAALDGGQHERCVARVLPAHPHEARIGELALEAHDDLERAIVMGELASVRQHRSDCGRLATLPRSRVTHPSAGSSSVAIDAGQRAPNASAIEWRAYILWHERPSRTRQGAQWTSGCRFSLSLARHLDRPGFGRRRRDRALRQHRARSRSRLDRT